MMRFSDYLGLIGLCACTHVAAAQISDEIIKVGILTDLHATYAEIGGQGAIIAAQMAIDDFGGKIQGKPIELISGDHQNKADVAANIARDWFDNQKVDVIAEMVTSSTALAVQQLGKTKNRMVITTGAASPSLTNKDCSPTGIHWVFDTYSLASGTANAIIQQGGDSWFFLTADYTFGHALEDDVSRVIKARGGKVLGSAKHPFQTPDFSEFLEKAQASKAQIIGLANAGNDTINSIKQAAKMGITQAGQKLAGLLVFITDIHSLGLEATQGLLFTTAFYWDYDEQTRAWSERFIAKHHRAPTMVQAGVYSALTHYFKAIDALKTDEATEVIAKMRELPINDFFARHGKLREDGRMVHDMYLVEVKKPSESKKPWDYYNIKQVIPSEQAFRSLEQSTCPHLKK
jgi:branched-chain amino acid transport system substrate-binding protein